ncbi:MAG: hypothetical protein JSV78_03660 [Phycisphaerales bacterium]|nr:MAG: hypothetical protein JSV78_03660 [Phycisphaerales bacterium]
MKVVLILIIIVAVGGFITFKYTDLGSFDPSEQGKQVKVAIKPGMTFQKVIELANEPREYSSLIRKVEMVDGEEIEVFSESVYVRFEKARFIKRLDDGELMWGFAFPYDFSKSVAFQVNFAGDGTVIDVHDLITEADIWERAGGGPGD